MAKSLEQLRAERDRQVSELNAELVTTRDKHIHTESIFGFKFLFLWQIPVMSDSIPLPHKSTSVKVVPVVWHFQHIWTRLQKPMRIQGKVMLS